MKKFSFEVKAEKGSSSNSCGASMGSGVTKGSCAC